MNRRNLLTRGIIGAMTIALAMASVRASRASISRPCIFRSRCRRGQSTFARVAAALIPALSSRAVEVSNAS